MAPLKLPSDGERIASSNGSLQVPDRPIIPFIEGDGIGAEIWNATRHVLDSAISKAYGSRRQIIWHPVLAGEKAFSRTGSWLPNETLEAFSSCFVGIKGPLTTPVGKGIRSLNVALRQQLDLYVCLRPVRYFPGIVSPVKRPDLVDVVIFRENIEDLYAGIEFRHESDDNTRFRNFIRDTFPDQFKRVRFPETTAYGIKCVSQEGSCRLIRAAIQYALRYKRRSVTLVHKGNIMKYTAGAFRDWGYQLARDEFGAQPIGDGPSCCLPQGLVIRDAITDAFFQQVLLQPTECDVIATLNLDGDYLSDAMAAQVGGIGMAPGANINYATGHAIFEATHGTAPSLAGLNRANPGSLILSGEMLLRHLGWDEAAALVMRGMETTISRRTVTHDLAQPMEQATELTCSDFAKAVTDAM